MSKVKVEVLRDGPIKVSGEVTLVDDEGPDIERQKDPIFLCRCGHSKSKPFCDGTHAKVSFKG